MALIVISVDRSELPPHTDEDFREWIKFEVGERSEIKLSNPLEKRELRATIREIGVDPLVRCPPLADKHKGMRISASGILLRVRGDLRFGAEEMHKHLTKMAHRYYEGDIKVVDEFLQLYCLDKNRPSA